MIRRYKVNDDFWVEFKNGKFWDQGNLPNQGIVRPNFAGLTEEWALAFWKRLKATVVEVPPLCPDLIESLTVAPTEPPAPVCWEPGYTLVETIG
jgi:hypothetical protein